MDLTPGCRVWRPPPSLHHHHRHHHHCHCHRLCFCAHHHHHHLHHHHRHHHLHHHQFNGHHHVCPRITSSFPRNPEPSGPVVPPNNLISGASGYEEAYGSATPMTLQEQEHEELEEEDDDDDDPVFVLTDEWREFFAKSEAKRKLEKKQAKKKGKK
ncbi:uncharacterized protein LOC132167324 [Corylus avellana]|uniref:uncharacterized protein LOC132167324 n=1 Tax=Corylus avellana TaxID=13451 RepID=UPI00286A097B|nr:uncharacterized protein LOC132167324 [Corylus avellana]